MSTSLLDELETAGIRVADRTGAATVAIGRSPRGSGFVVGNHRVLTNAHNLRDTTTLVTFADARSVQASVLAGDAASDLVVLDVDTADVEPLEWADRVPGTGAAVFSVARGVRGTRVSVGFVSGVDRTFRGPGGRPIGGGLEHTAPMARGSSGGPVVDRDGRVVGINTHRLGEGFYLAQSAEPSLVERIAAFTEGRSPSRPRLGIAVAPPEVARRLRRSVGLDERDGVLVRGVEDGSAADGAGLREGDLIVRAGSEAVASIDALHLVLDAHDPGQPLELGVVRGADELTLTASFATPDPSEDSED